MHAGVSGLKQDATSAPVTLTMMGMARMPEPAERVVVRVSGWRSCEFRCLDSRLLIPNGWDMQVHACR